MVTKFRKCLFRVGRDWTGLNQLTRYYSPNLTNGEYSEVIFCSRIIPGKINVPCTLFFLCFDCELAIFAD